MIVNGDWTSYVNHRPIEARKPYQYQTISQLANVVDVEHGKLRKRLP